MPRYRFSWDAFSDDTVAGLALALVKDAPVHFDGMTPRGFLQRRVPRPNGKFVRDQFRSILRHWVARQDGTARYLYRRMVNAGLGGFHPHARSHSGHMKFLRGARVSPRFRRFVLEALLRFGDQDRDPAQDVGPFFLQRFVAVPVAEVPRDPRRPHGYQKEAWSRLDAELAATRRHGEFQGLLVMPTGSGKTYTTVRWLTEKVVAKCGRVLWLAHRRELLEHAATEFHRAAVWAAPLERVRIRVVSGVHCSATMIDPEDHVVVASVSTLAHKPAIRDELLADPRTFVVVDEAHHSPAKTYRNLLKEVRRHRRFRVMGLTATPTRTIEDEIPILSRLYGGRVLYEVGLRRLVEQKILSRPWIVSVETRAEADADVTERDLRHFERFDDLSAEWLDRLANLGVRNDVIVSHYLKERKKYGKTLVFAINVAHAALLTHRLREAGVAAEYVASRRPDGTVVNRGEVLERFRDGDIDVLVNVQMLTEGVDIPGVQAVFLARPTKSEILLRQMIGRGLRGPKCGGPERAYLVSFEDHWERFTDWQCPLMQLRDVVEESARTKEDAGVAPTLEAGDSPGVDNLLGHLPWDLLASTARELSRLGDPRPLMAFEAVPAGHYVFEYDGPGDDEDMRVAVPYFEHQLPCWERALDDLWHVSRRHARKVQVEDLHDAFGDCDDPIPARRDIEQAIALRRLGGDRPAPIPLVERDVCDPHAVARRIVDAELGPTAAGEVIKAAYTKLARVVYGEPCAFREAVALAVDAILNPRDAQFTPKGVPLFDPGSGQMLRPGRQHDLPSSFGQMASIALPILKAAGKLDAKVLPFKGRLEWTRWIISSWYGLARSQEDGGVGEGRIRINVLLDSPDVPESVLQWLLFHEYLHLHLQCGHTREFRQLEARYPGHTEAERFLDTLNERFGVDRQC